MKKSKGKGSVVDLCFKSPEAATLAAAKGVDFNNVQQELKTLNQPMTFVSCFLPIEFPDSELTNLLQMYGEVKLKEQGGFTTRNRASKIWRMGAVWYPSPSLKNLYQFGFPIRAYRSVLNTQVNRDPASDVHPLSIWWLNALIRKPSPLRR